MRFLLVLALFLSPCAYSEEGSTAGEFADLLAMAKYVGGCGIFRQMIIFQESTQMPGGDQFIARFLRTEAARLGNTPEEYTQKCLSMTDTYVALVADLEKMGQ